MEIEKELNNLKVEILFNMTKEDWYDFLYNKYFFWKYTSPNRLVTTRNHLRKYEDTGTLDELDDIRKKIITLDHNDIKNSLFITQQIKGLGIAGASGLLALLYPTEYATVDQFVVGALREIESQKHFVEKMVPESLTLENGVVLINIMKEKAKILNETNDTTFWTPRKVDMALWAYRE
jgi:thermostable 8-oxoguanine DNA glycosylase